MNCNDWKEDFKGLLNFFHCNDSEELVLIEDWHVRIGSETYGGDENTYFVFFKLFNTTTNFVTSATDMRYKKVGGEMFKKSPISDT